MATQTPTAAPATAVYRPVVARSTTLRRPLPPHARDCVTVMVVRSGSAVMLSEFGEQVATVGDVVLLGGNTLCGVEPRGPVTLTTLYLDSDYIVDQIFWQNAAVVADKGFAMQFAESVYTEPAQVVRLGRRRLETLGPWLDELVALSVADALPARFYRMQALLFAVLDVIIPFVRTPAVTSGTGTPAGAAPAVPRRQEFLPLRPEAALARQLMDDAPAEPWTLGQLAERVHLSEKQFSRVFVEAYGRTPLAYLTTLRVERMAALLRTGELGVADAGRAVGWSSRSRAAEAFRRSLGVTPQQYRARVRELGTA